MYSHAFFLLYHKIVCNFIIYKDSWMTYKSINSPTKDHVANIICYHTNETNSLNISESCWNILHFTHSICKFPVLTIPNLLVHLIICFVIYKWSSLTSLFKCHFRKVYIKTINTSCDMWFKMVVFLGCPIAAQFSIPVGKT